MRRKRQRYGIEAHSAAVAHRTHIDRIGAIQLQAIQHHHRIRRIENRIQTALLLLELQAPAGLLAHRHPGERCRRTGHIACSKADDRGARSARIGLIGAQIQRTAHHTRVAGEVGGRKIVELQAVAIVERRRSDMQRIVAVLGVDKADIELAHIGAVVRGLEVDNLQTVSDTTLDGIKTIFAVAAHVADIIALLVAPHDAVVQSATAVVAIVAAAGVVLRGVGNDGSTHNVAGAVVDAAAVGLGGVADHEAVADETGSIDINSTAIVCCIVVAYLTTYEACREITVLPACNSLRGVGTREVDAAAILGPVRGDGAAHQPGAIPEVGAAAVGRAAVAHHIAIAQCEAVPFHILAGIADIILLIQHTSRIAAVEDGGVTFDVALGEVVVLGFVTHKSAIHADRGNHQESTILHIRTAVVDTFCNPHVGYTSVGSHLLRQVDVVHGIAPGCTVGSTGSLRFHIYHISILRQPDAIIRRLVAAHIHTGLLHTGVSVKVGCRLRIAILAAVDAYRPLLQTPVASAIGSTRTLRRHREPRTIGALIHAAKRIIAIRRRACHPLDGARPHHADIHLVRTARIAVAPENTVVDVIIVGGIQVSTCFVLVGGLDIVVDNRHLGHPAVILDIHSTTGATGAVVVD